MNRSFWIAFGVVVLAFVLTPVVFRLTSPSRGGELALGVAVVQLVLTAGVGVLFIVGAILIYARHQDRLRDLWRGMGLGLAVGLVLGFVSCLGVGRM